MWGDRLKTSELPFSVISENIKLDEEKENKALEAKRPRSRVKKKVLDTIDTNTIDTDKEGRKFIPIETKEEIEEDIKDNVNNYVGAENPIELSLKSAQAPRSEIEAITDAQLQIHAEKTNITDKFLASRIQKTEVKKDHRVVIPIMNMLAENPLPNIACHVEDEKLKEEIENEFKIPYLSEFINGFIEYGIPVDRKGRKEEVEVLSAYLRQVDGGVGIEQKSNKGFR